MIKNITFFALFALCLIGCSSGSSGASSSSSSSTEYDAEIYITTPTTSYTTDDNIIVTIGIDNNGPDTITEQFSVKIYASEDGGDYEQVGEFDSDFDVTTAEIAEWDIELGTATAAEYIFMVVGTFENDTDTENNVATSEFITVSIPTIIAPAGDG